MINYTKKNVLLITLVITLIIYLCISVILCNISKQQNTSDTVIEETITQETQENTSINENKNNIWQIQIPKLNLIADISEGTNQRVIAKYVGHFSKTSITDGNIGLAAHNRGYGVESYFKDIKSLNLGDEIIYKKDEDIREYEVIKNIIIDETDWTYLQNTNDNRITLITCVENEPQYRRCVQGIEKGTIK